MPPRPATALAEAPPWPCQGPRKGSPRSLGQSQQLRLRPRREEAGRPRSRAGKCSSPQQVRTRRAQAIGCRTPNPGTQTGPQARGRRLRPHARPASLRPAAAAGEPRRIRSAVLRQEVAPARGTRPARRSRRLARRGRRLASRLAGGRALTALRPVQGSLAPSPPRPTLQHLGPIPSTALASLRPRPATETPLLTVPPRAACHSQAGLRWARGQTRSGFRTRRAEPSLPPSRGPALPAGTPQPRKLQSRPWQRTWQSWGRPEFHIRRSRWGALPRVNRDCWAPKRCDSADQKSLRRCQGQTLELTQSRALQSQRRE
mmetsp:Transcript_716/g.2849  ORF Transcript_716/g.2849 Transcript_716/m.2849 type:complete len:316 (-) Transcript_716:716-1663(-)